MCDRDLKTSRGYGQENQVTDKPSMEYSKELTLRNLNSIKDSLIKQLCTVQAAIEATLKI